MNDSQRLRVKLDTDDRDAVARVLVPLVAGALVLPYVALVVGVALRVFLWASGV